MRVARHRVLIAEIATSRIWKFAVLTAAGAVGTASQANAALYYYSDPGYYYQQEAQSPRKPPLRARHATPKKNVVVKDTTVHPQMPLIIAVSIQKQRVKIYDANGFFAEAPVSTGMAGHPTPMGVFSVIEKDRYHRSNIYSGAPMPFMQRITWSGVAMHAGVLPGYPASHGCIRMPESFAIKMWGWTKLGARVIVTPGELPMPVSFTHPMLPLMKVVPQPPVADTDEPVAPKADKGAPDVKTEELELRPTVGHADVTPVVFDKTRTADASGDGINIKSAVRMLDAPRISPNVTVAEAKDTKTEVKSPDPIAAAKPVEATPSEEKSKQIEAAAKPDGESAKPDDTDPPAAKAEEPAEAKADAAKSEATAVPVKVAETAGETKPGPAPTEAKPTPKADAPKDQTRVLPVTKQPKRREGQIAVFISRKDSKLYVRQNFAPLFQVPVTIAPSDRPFGTHVFTAELDKNDPNILHWSVVTVPSRAVTREQSRAIRTKKGKPLAPPVEAKPTPAVDTAAEALDRITIPADAMARVVEALTTGGSIIVSDQGINQGDTGEGTDFIVSLR